MSGRRLRPLVFMLLIGLVMTGLGLLQSPPRAAAQCSGDQPSACCACHAETHPVASRGAWHVEHVGRDCCWYCHGGNTQTSDKDEAHRGVVRQPLDDAYLSCHSCHPADYHDRAAKFGVILKVTPGSSEPVTPPAQAVRSPSAAQSAEPSARLDNGRLTLIVVLIDAVALSGLGWLGWRLSKRSGV